jgi:hypothetical protein
MIYSTDPYKAISQLSHEFDRVPHRIVVDIFRGYLGRADSIPAAARATRQRIIDSCRAV